jgi:hypothetical protein
MMKKSPFIHQKISNLKPEDSLYLDNIKKLFEYISLMEIITYIPPELSFDKKIRPLFLSREIVDKIEYDHGSICIENLIITANYFEYATTNVLGNQDKINLIKQIPNSDNYLLITAIRINGYFTLTHFETESKNGNNLKRLLDRGNVINRVSSIACTTDQDSNKNQSREVI